MSYRSGGRLFVGNLHEEIDKRDLKSEFMKFGRINSIWVSFKSPRFAFVEFQREGDAAKARAELDGFEMLGSRLRVEFSREQMHLERRPQAFPIRKRSELPFFKRNGAGFEEKNPHMVHRNTGASGNQQYSRVHQPCNTSLSESNSKPTFFVRTRNFYNSNRFKPRCNHYDGDSSRSSRALNEKRPNSDDSSD